MTRTCMDRDTTLHDSELKSFRFDERGETIVAEFTNCEKNVVFDGVIGGRFVFGSRQRSVYGLLVEPCSTERADKLGLVLRDPSYQVDTKEHLLVDFEFNTPDDMMLVCKSYRYVDAGNV